MLLDFLLEVRGAEKLNIIRESWSAVTIDHCFSWLRARSSAEVSGLWLRLSLMTKAHLHKEHMCSWREKDQPFLSPPHACSVRHVCNACVCLWDLNTHHGLGVQPQHHQLCGVIFFFALFKNLFPMEFYIPPKQCKGNETFMADSSFDLVNMLKSVL